MKFCVVQNIHLRPSTNSANLYFFSFSNREKTAQKITFASKQHQKKRELFPANGMSASLYANVVRQNWAPSDSIALPLRTEIVEQHKK